MTGIRHRLLATIGLIGALALGGCGYNDGFGYSGVSVGTGYYGGGGFYGDGYYGPGGFYQPGAFGGWYNNFYYPGSGIYVYDRGGRRHRWNDGQRRYWEGRRVERRDDRWRGRENVGRGEWRGRGNDGRRGTYVRPRPQPGVEGDRGRGRWQGNNAVRPSDQARPPRQGGRQMSQPRPERNMGVRSAPNMRADRPSRSNSRGPAMRTRPN